MYFIHVSGNSTERSQAGQLLRLIGMCMRTICTPLQPIRYLGSTASRWLIEKRIFLSMCQPQLDGFCYLVPGPHALLTVSVWLPLPTKERHFAYKAYCLFSYICASILVIFLKIDISAQMMFHNIWVGGMRNSVSGWCAVSAAVIVGPFYEASNWHQYIRQILTPCLRHVSYNKRTCASFKKRVQQRTIVYTVQRMVLLTEK